MEKSVAITTTNGIENTTIERYLGTVTAHVVLGTHFFSDFAASFTDLFGGQSGTYQRKLDNLYQIAITRLQEKAYQKGANAIIGLKVDFGEISGKGKSMFMVSATGTSVKLRYNTSIDKDKQNEEQVNIVPLRNLETKLEQQRLIERFKSGRMIYQENWDFLFENPDNEMNELILDRYIDDSIIEDQDLLKLNVQAYFGCIEPEDAIECLYGRLENDGRYADIIRANNLFSPGRVLNLFEKGRMDLAITCLDIDKLSYDREADIPLMEKLAEKFDDLPNTGEIKIVKGGMMSKDKEKFICSEGHQNNVANEFCEVCSRNIKGLTRYDAEKIGKFKNKIGVLKKMMNV